MTYKATVERDGRFWLVRVEGVGATQARHLRELDAMARDLVAVMTDLDADEVEVEYDFRLPGSVQDHLERAEQLRQESARANSASAAELRAAVRELADEGLTVRDIGQVLGMSYQRAHQLLSDEEPLAAS
jgi:DNA-directed RNA polymerase specialized sigma24 family protein